MTLNAAQPYRVRRNSAPWSRSLGFGYDAMCDDEMGGRGAGRIMLVQLNIGTRVGLNISKW